MKQDELIEIFKGVVKNNPNAILSGSLSLKLQNFKLPRPSEDIDLYLPFGDEFNPIYWKGASPISVMPALYFNDSWEEIIDEKTKRTSFKYAVFSSGVEPISLKIDVFQPIKINNIEVSKIYCNNIPCQHFSNILKRKTFYALNGSEKHKDDLIYILNNNVSKTKYKIEENIGEGIGKIQQEEFTEPPFNINLSRPLIFFDAETTGIDKVNDRIIELCTIKYFPNGESETKTQLFNPTIPIPKSASDIHGITDEDVKNKPTFADKAKELSKYFQNCDLAGYNIISFDVPIIVEEFLRAGVSLPFDDATKYLDALKIFYDNEKRDLTSAYKFYCKKDLAGAHSAEVDVLATIEVLNGQIDRYELDNSVDALHDICNDSEIIDYERKFVRNEDGDIVFTFGKHKGMCVEYEKDYLEWMLKSDFANYTKLVIRKIITGEMK